VGFARVVACRLELNSLSAAEAGETWLATAINAYVPVVLPADDRVNGGSDQTRMPLRLARA
jgi:hypothetical protein